MQTLAPTHTPPSSKIVTRAGLAEHTALSLRYVDTLTQNGTLPHFRIGKSVRYSLSEVEAVLREKFYVRAKVRKSANA
jgi:excisionase family DNA binding protein